MECTNENQNQQNLFSFISVLNLNIFATYNFKFTKILIKCSPFHSMPNIIKRMEKDFRKTLPKLETLLDNFLLRLLHTHLADYSFLSLHSSTKNYTNE